MQLELKQQHSVEKNVVELKKSVYYKKKILINKENGKKKNNEDSLKNEHPEWNNLRLKHYDQIKLIIENLLKFLKSYKLLNWTAYLV